jgi:hypothetical protein
MTDRPPIPRALWDRIVAFLASGSTGQIVLDVNRGRVVSASLNERVREDWAAPVETPVVTGLKMR